MRHNDDTPGPSPPSPNPVTQVSWNWIAGGDNVNLEPFDDSQSGWQLEFDASTTEFDFFQATFPANAIELITSGFNNFADATISSSNSLSRRQRKWCPVQSREIIRYLSIRILMGIDRKPEYAHYWSKDPLLKSLVIPQIMTSDRFFEMHRYLHFSENNAQQPGDQLQKIRALWNIFMKTFSEILIPYKNMSIDESLIKFKGRLS